MIDTRNKATSETIVAEGNAPRSTRDLAQLYIASIGGAFVLVIADLSTNIDAATTLKIGGVLEQFLLGETFIGPGVLGLLVLVLLSLFFCWLYNPDDKVTAFTRGVSIFAVLSAITPYSVIDTESERLGETASQNQVKITAHDHIQRSSFFPAAIAQDQPQCVEKRFEPNATLSRKKSVSSCRPHYAGFLGLGSFFNNTIEYCESPYRLEADTRVRLLDSWNTGLRGYRYSEVEFLEGDRVCKGWVSDGRKSVRHVDLDNPEPAR
ncbi:MAG: hypothetical protein AAF699_21825 [Pseudomonadota bacterium]